MDDSNLKIKESDRKLAKFLGFLLKIRESYSKRRIQ
jgi:hypothetical protein